MRTTVSIDDGLLATAKQCAEEKRLTLGQLVEASLRAYLAAPPSGVESHLLPVFGGTLGYRPGMKEIVETPAALKEFLFEEDIAHFRAAGGL